MDTEKTIAANFSKLVLAYRNRAERRATVRTVTGRTQTPNTKFLKTQHKCQQHKNTFPCSSCVRRIAVGPHDSACYFVQHVIFPLIQSRLVSLSVAQMFSTCYFPRITNKSGAVRTTSYWGASMQPLLQCKSNNYYIFSACACSLMYPACNVHAPHYITICGLPGCTIFFHITS